MGNKHNIIIEMKARRSMVEERLSVRRKSAVVGGTEGGEGGKSSSDHRPQRGAAPPEDVRQRRLLPMSCLHTIFIHFNIYKMN